MQICKMIMARYKCNLIIPGFPKCGTSSFHEYLDQHPDICMSRPKEFHYFSRKDIWAMGVERHNKLFLHQRGNEKWYGESSTLNCASDDALDRIADCLVNPKVIILMRHPVNRTISHYRWLYALGQERLSFKDAIRKYGHTFHPDKPVDGRNHKGYLTFSEYANHVPRFMKALGEENVLLIFSENLQASPESELEKVWKFLDLPKISVISTRNDNATTNVPASGVHPLPRILRWLAPKKFRKFITSLPVAGNAWKKLTGNRKTISPPTINDEDKAWLTEISAEHINYYNQHASK